MKAMQRVAAVPTVAAWLLMGLVAATFTAEYFDGYQNILTGLAVHGDSTQFYPKNPLLSSLVALLYLPIRALGLARVHAAYHLPLVALTLAGMALLSRFFTRLVPGLTLVTVLGVFTLNRITLSYTPFALPDMLAGLSVGLWWWADLSQPVESRRGKVARTVALSLCALGRLQTILIPLVSLSVTAWRTRKARACAEIAFGAGAVYALYAGLFIVAGNHLGIFQLPEGIAANFSFLKDYFGMVAGDPVKATFGEYLGAVWGSLTPVGLGLAALGLVALRKQRRKKPFSRMSPVGSLVGSLVFLVFQLTIRNTQADRYLTPLMPVWVCLECLGVKWLLERKAWLWPVAAAGLFGFSAVPVARHFSNPVYRLNLERRSLERFEAWAAPLPLVLFPREYMIAPLFSKSAKPHVYDPEFYRYWGGLLAYDFSFGRALRLQPRVLTFKKYGFPIADQLRTAVPEGVVMLLPGVLPRRGEADFLVEPVTGVRWWREKSASRACSPRVADACVESYVPPGETF